MSTEPAPTHEQFDSNLIITDNQSVALALQQALARLGENGPDDAVVTFDDTAFAIQTRGHRTQRVLVALGSDVMRGLAAVRTIREISAVPLYVVGPRDAGLILDAVHAGADNFIEDFDPLDEYLARALARPVTNGKSPTEGKLICVASARGGCGSSLIAVNLAAAFSQRLKRAALCDFDFQNGVCDALLNLKPKHTILDLLGCAAGLDRNSIDAALTRHSSGVHLLPAPSRPVQPDHQLADLCQRVVRAMRQSFPVVVVDLPHSTYDLELEPLLSACSKLLLVTQLEFNSLRSARRTLDRLAKAGVSQQRIQVVGNRDGQPNSLSVAHAEEALNCKISHTILDDPRSVNRSVNCGMPFYTSMAGSPLAKRIDSLAESLLNDRGQVAATRVTKALIPPPWHTRLAQRLGRWSSCLTGQQNEHEASH